MQKQKKSCEGLKSFDIHARGHSGKTKAFVFAIYCFFFSPNSFFHVLLTSTKRKRLKTIHTHTLFRTWKRAK